MNFDKYRHYTQARIGLGRAGSSLPTKAWLEFAYEHAAAVDAVSVPWDVKAQLDEVKSLGVEALELHSEVKGRPEYLLRPDKGRKLNSSSIGKLWELGEVKEESILITASNGLSTFAIKNHLKNFLSVLLPQLKNLKMKITHDTVFLVPNGRVALMDEIGEILKPSLGIMLIGERPGLSSPDSLAAYLTYRPRFGLSDADRNCISNIRSPHGLSYDEAAFKTMFLVNESIRRKVSGVDLKDESHLLT